MVRLQPWQWLVLIAPIASVVVFLLISAGFQIHEWGLNWIWAIVALVFVGWRWLLVKWTRPAFLEVEKELATLAATLPHADPTQVGNQTPAIQQAEAELQRILEDSRQDPPLWQDWDLFWQRCLSLISAIAQAYAPKTKQPLLNIYLPQAYGLLRGTIDDLDQWMQKLAPLLNQLTIGQAYEAYQIYQKFAPSARKVWQAWGLAQWLLNPIAAATRTATQGNSDRATQEFIGNLSQLLREAVLRNLAQQAIALYSGQTAAKLPTIPSSPPIQPATPKPETQTLRDLISQAKPIEIVQEKPINLLLVGRTGSGKSSIVNTLFVQPSAKAQPQAEVDALPSTNRIRDYHWQSSNHTGQAEVITLWDTPGYEQVNRPAFREIVIDHARDCDLVLLATPALDPALQMDVDFLEALQATVPDLPTIAVMTQVDRLRPLREWDPPYDWKIGHRPKELAIRDAIAYRQEILPAGLEILPLVTQGGDRQAWGEVELAQRILGQLDRAKQQRLARFLKDRDSRIHTASQIIEQYAVQMTTRQGLTTFLKSPILAFLSTLATGNARLAVLLAEQIPVEQLPVVIGKLQMAYELFQLFATSGAAQPSSSANFDLLSLWGLATQLDGEVDRNAWAFGQTLVEYWSSDRLSAEQLQTRFQDYLSHLSPTPDPSDIKA
ncbi:MAG: GTPase [Synechococcales bacterium]|nr:GTPase [Synechococcales bacterium]